MALMAANNAYQHSALRWMTIELPRYLQEHVKLQGGKISTRIKAAAGTGSSSHGQSAQFSTTTST
jgi:hypothetical protein